MFSESLPRHTIGTSRQTPWPETIDSIVEAVLAKESVPSIAVGLRFGRDFLFIKAYGVADVDRNVPARADTIYHISSLTKQFTAAAILQLVERGYLGLDDHVTAFLPDLPIRARQISIRHLLTHTSGLGDYPTVPPFEEPERLDLPRERLLNVIRHIEFAPGENHRYCNSGYDLLGLVIEVVTGRPYPEYVGEHILTRAGVTRTYFTAPPPSVEGKAPGYTVADRRRKKAGAISWVPLASGGSCSTVEDLLTWQAALNSGTILDASSLREMRAAGRLRDGSEIPYCLGFLVKDFEGSPRFIHRGGIHGFASSLSYDPALDLTIAVLSNADFANPLTVDGAITRMIRDSHTETMSR